MTRESTVELGTLYDFNKSAMKNEKPLDPIVLNRKISEIAQWAFNDNNFSNLMVEILIRKKDPIKVGRKIVG